MKSSAMVSNTPDSSSSLELFQPSAEIDATIGNTPRRASGPPVAESASAASHNALQARVIASSRDMS
ncbi:MAG: hypothetical protein ACK55Z_10035, partial [bacterium]